MLQLKGSVVFRHMKYFSDKMSILNSEPQWFISNVA